MSKTALSPEQVSRRGRELYERDIRALVESDHHGEFLALNIMTGEYEIDQSDVTALDRMGQKGNPEHVYLLRVGFPAAYRLGGRFGIERP
jgi:hypothetical protein